jgi:fido (protein-threonine AMPylation protein)
VEHPCPKGWVYETHPKRKKLKDRSADLLERLRRRKIDGLRAARDSRQAHADLFRELTPPHFPYYAGNYRGERLRCLQTYTVGIERPTASGRVVADPLVGAQPQDVARRMEELARHISDAVAEVDRMRAAGTLSAADQLLHVVGVACDVFDLFLQVHPYANGNGHAARFIMRAILGRYDYWVRRTWTVEPRPADPPYTSLLVAHRDGNTRPLIEYVINCIK